METAWTGLGRQGFEWVPMVVAIEMPSSDSVPHLDPSLLGSAGLLLKERFDRNPFVRESRWAKNPHVTIPKVDLEGEARAGRSALAAYTMQASTSRLPARLASHLGTAGFSVSIDMDQVL